MSENDKIILNTRRRKFLGRRKEYGAVNEQEAWRNGTDQGLRELCIKLLIYYCISETEC
jgi:hypothetical protein